MDKTITTALLIIASVVSVVFMFNAVYPAVIETSEAMLDMERRLDERFQSQVEIIHAAPYGTDTKVVYLWIKNIGATSIRAMDRCDLFFGPEGNFERIPYETGASHWSCTVENDTTWKPTATLKVTIDYADYLVNGERYYIKFIAPNGVSDEYYLTK